MFVHRKCVRADNTFFVVFFFYSSRSCRFKNPFDEFFNNNNNLTEKRMSIMSDKTEKVVHYLCFTICSKLKPLKGQCITQLIRSMCKNMNESLKCTLLDFASFQKLITRVLSITRKENENENRQNENSPIDERQKYQHQTFLAKITISDLIHINLIRSQIE